MRYIIVSFLVSFILFECKIDEPQNPPSVITNSASEIQLKSVLLNGEVIDEGYSTATERGFVYSEKNSTPSVSDSKLISGYGKGKFSISLSNLIPNTKYYYRAFATNTKGVSYGEVMNVTTLDFSLPKVTTNSPTKVTEQEIEITGIVNDNGGSSIIESGFVYSKAQNPTLENSVGYGTLNTQSPQRIINLSANTKYYIRAYAKNIKGISYGNEISFTTLDFTLPSTSIESISGINYTSAYVRANVENLGGGTFIEGGFVLSKTPNSSAYEMKFAFPRNSISYFGGNISKLDVNTKYYLKAYIINEKGISYSNEMNFTTLSLPVVKSKTGRVWMDRNLGATSVASSISDSQAFGDLYQWGRRADGHQKKNSTTTNLLATTTNPANAFFILSNNKPFDWLVTSNDNLWQPETDFNNVCPSGFRLPTIDEWKDEVSTWGSKDIAGGYASPLKLPNTLIRGGNDNIIYSGAWYWSSSRDSFENSFAVSYAMSLRTANQAGVTGVSRSFGLPVRCIKD